MLKYNIFMIGKQNLYQIFYNKISAITPIPLDQWNIFEKNLKVEIFKKNKIIFKQGDVDLHIYFVMTGLSYSYYVSNDGEQYVKNFYWPGRVIAPWSSFLLNQPSAFTVKALQDTLVISILAETYREFEERHHSWLVLSKKLTERALIDREQREYNSLMLGTEAHYKTFVTQHKDIISEIPQNLIALYLGVNPASLSRIKRNKVPSS